MPPTKRTPVGKAGVQRELDGSRSPDTATGLAAQMISARFGVGPARARLLADFAFGGHHG